jgi:aerobic-type carbon monoxide dehydrogenase small subunit (CoxS/CutS family)
MEATFTFTVNGQQHLVTTDPERPLLEVLREQLRLTGTKFGCGQGQCGACTVLINGQRAQACQTPISKVQNQSILTVEGLAKDGALHPVQQIFLEEKAFQCGYCTPGMMLGTVALLNEKPHPTDAEIVSYMDRHLCRCNHYTQIFKAVRRATR